MALFRTGARFKHMRYPMEWWDFVPKQFNDKTAVMAVGARGVKLADKVGYKLTGSGLHGPENPDVMKLVMWNRLKQKRPQRTYIPTDAEYRDYFKMETAILWFCFSMFLLYWPFCRYAEYYSSHHDHHPWMPPRTDGSRGFGPHDWWRE